MTDEKTIPTNIRLLIILEELAKAGIPLTPTEVNAQINLPKPTIHRLFSLLEEEGFLQRDLDEKKYTPGARLRSLASAVLSSHSIRAARQMILQELAQSVGETMNIALPDRHEMIYIERQETHWPLRIQLAVGTRVPLYCTASGKLYLSTLRKTHIEQYLKSIDLKKRAKNSLINPENILQELRTIRQNGYSFDNEEFMTGMIALAVPIKDQNNRLFATLSFHAPIQRMNHEQALKHLDKLLHASKEIAELSSEELS